MPTEIQHTRIGGVWLTDGTRRHWVSRRSVANQFIVLAMTKGQRWRIDQPAYSLTQIERACKSRFTRLLDLDFVRMRNPCPGTTGRIVLSTPDRGSEIVASFEFQDYCDGEEYWKLVEAEHLYFARALTQSKKENPDG
jgi:hypothetical protein